MTTVSVIIIYQSSTDCIRQTLGGNLAIFSLNAFSSVWHIWYTSCQRHKLTTVTCSARMYVCMYVCVPVCPQWLRLAISHSVQILVYSLTSVIPGGTLVFTGRPLYDVLVSILKKVKAVLSYYLRTMGCCLPYEITQYYLPPDPSEQPVKAGTLFTYPGGMEGWVDLGGWLHTEMVYPPKDGHPSKY